TLNLGGTKVTDAGLKELAAVDSLKGLSFFHLRTEFETLRLHSGGTQVTDAGQVDAEDSWMRTLLVAFGAQRTDAGQVDAGPAIELLSNPTSFHSADTRVTGLGLRELKGLRNLRTL